MTRFSSLRLHVLLMMLAGLSMALIGCGNNHKTDSSPEAFSCDFPVPDSLKPLLQRNPLQARLDAG